MDLVYLGLLILAYLTGSIASAILVCRLLTLPDPRIAGSNNPGATNVLRIGGTKAALLTLVGDIFKTALPIMLAWQLGYSAVDTAWLGVCSLIGHCFPLYFSFRGGKGVASMLTVITLVYPPFMLLSLTSWLLGLFTFRRSSIASMITAIIIPVFANNFSPDLLLPFSSLSGVVFIRHRKNIANLIQGKEPIIGKGLVDKTTAN